MGKLNVEELSERTEEDPEVSSDWRCPELEPEFRSWGEEVEVEVREVEPRGSSVGVPRRR